MISKKQLLYFHWFACSTGLIGIVYGLSWKVFAALFAGDLADYKGLNAWVMPFVFPEKPQQLMFYIGGGLTIFLYYIGILFLTKKRPEIINRSYPVDMPWSFSTNVYYILTPVLINVIVGMLFPSGNRPHLPVAAYPLAALWVGGLLIPLWKPILMSKETIEDLLNRSRPAIIHLAESLQTKRWNPVYWIGTIVIMGGVIIQFATIIVPYLTKPILMTNEYMDIPEWTKLNGKYVENAEYINEHNLLGLNRYIHEVDQGRSPAPPVGTFMEIDETPLLTQFIDDHSDKYYYDRGRGVLSVHGPMTIEERSLLGLIIDPDKQKELTGLYYSSNNRYETDIQPPYSPEEKEFLKKNAFELHWKFLSRWVIHHHNFVIGPIIEISLGRPFKEINIQYGFLNAVIMAYLLNMSGGISYQNYFQKWYAIWLGYYAIFIGISAYIIRRADLLLVLFILAFGFINMIDYQFIYLGPGLNPARHFLDIIIIFLLYHYWRNANNAILIGIVALEVIAVLNNEQFGMFIVAATSATMLIKQISEKGRIVGRESTMAAIIFGLCTVIVIIPDFGNNILASYYVKGLLGFPVSTYKIVLIMFAIMAMYIALLWIQDIVPAEKYTAFALLLYGQGVLIYSIWGGTDKHWLKAGTLLALGGVVFVKIILDRAGAIPYGRLCVIGLIIWSLISVYLPGLREYYSSRSVFLEVFEDHRVYDWDLERAKFRSTMDPRYFIEAVDLIKKYSLNRYEIYMVSKYDSILPFLAGKYSGMPFRDLQWFLMSSNELKLCVNTLEKKRPDYLFVDSDIERNFNGETALVSYQNIVQVLDGSLMRAQEVNERKHLLELVTRDNASIDQVASDHNIIQNVDESLMRVQRINELKQLFQTVKEDYMLIDRGTLISVYKRLG